MKFINTLTLISCLVWATSCSTKSSTSETTTDTLAVESNFVAYSNPPADGFNQERSDLLATLLADKAMMAMGGREAWDSTRFIKWTFFGRRIHLWDKWTGDVRIESPANEMVFLMNIHTKKGRIQRSGTQLTDSLDFYLQKGYEAWVNDSYWLVMPYKLKDSGVTLKYLREDTTQMGVSADVVSLAFESVGVTPQNIYEVWIDTDSKLVTQWAFYPDSSSIEPMFITPWTDYKEYGGILLSGNRGDYALTEIEVLEDVPEGTFTQF